MRRAALPLVLLLLAAPTARGEDAPAPAAPPEGPARTVAAVLPFIQGARL